MKGKGLLIPLILLTLASPSIAESKKNISKRTPSLYELIEKQSEIDRKISLLQQKILNKLPSCKTKEDTLKTYFTEAAVPSMKGKIKITAGYGRIKINKNVNNTGGNEEYDVKKHYRNHTGIDRIPLISEGKRNDTLYASFDGVTKIGWKGGYGRYVEITSLIEFPSPTSKYKGYAKLTDFHAHLRKWLINNNEFVEKGQPIGIIGQSGRSRGIHNHWEVYFGDKRINPRNISIYF